MPYLQGQSQPLRQDNKIPVTELLQNDKHAVSDEDSDGMNTNGSSNPIHQHVLLLSNSVSDNTANEEHRKKRRQKWSEKEQKYKDRPAPAVILKKDLQCGVDYYLVGANTWTLLSGKFGSDVEMGICRPCVASTKQRGQICVKIDNKTLVDIPLRGYFSYEQNDERRAAAAAGRDENVMVAQPQDGADLVSEEGSTDGMGNDLVSASGYR
jgi:hypothetical protein